MNSTLFNSGRQRTGFIADSNAEGRLCGDSNGTSTVMVSPSSTRLESMVRGNAGSIVSRKRIAGSLQNSCCTIVAYEYLAKCHLEGLERVGRFASRKATESFTTSSPIPGSIRDSGSIRLIGRNSTGSAAVHGRRTVERRGCALDQLHLPEVQWRCLQHSEGVGFRFDQRRYARGGHHDLV